MFIFFSKLISKLEFKKSPIQVHIIPYFKSTKSFKTNLHCIWAILIFSSKSEFEKSPVHIKLKINYKFQTNLGCIWVILIFSPNRFPKWNLRNPNSVSYHTKLKINCKFQSKSGLYLGDFYFFSLNQFSS